MCILAHENFENFVFITFCSQVSIHVIFQVASQILKDFFLKNHESFEQIVARVKLPKKHHEMRSYSQQ